jgi:glycolate oxidase FAD binding subunit
MATDMLTPASEEEAAEIVKASVADGHTLEIAGGRTKRGIGQTLEADRLLSTVKLIGITEYNPGELVISARAGTPFADIEAALALNNQMLAFQPGDWRSLFGSNGTPTIGGIVAANISGSRRIAAGAARDSLLGVRFANGAGEIIKNGGKVMKNVTGLDLVKMMAGSWGTLGLITEVSLKVLPLPETESTLAIRGVSDSKSAAIMAAAMGTSADVTGAAHLPGSVTGRVQGGALAGNPVTLLRLEGFAKSVLVRLDKLRAVLPADSDTDVIEGEASARLWRDLSDVAPFAGNATPLWKISVAPMAGHAVASAVLDKLDGEVFFDWQGGLIWLQLASETDASASLVRQAVASNGGGHATLIRASDEIRSSVTVFQPQAPALAALSRRVRAAVDPSGVFNPGRMVFDAVRKAA